MIYSSNITAEEQFRFFGAIHGDQAIGLLDSLEKIESLDGIDAHVAEAIGCFPSEDFLSASLDELRYLAKSLRGNNREELLRIVAQLDELRESTNQSTEYGGSELRKVKEALEVL